MTIFNKILSLLFIVMFLSGCTGLRAVKTIGDITHEEIWYINPNFKDSQMLGSGTSDYGAASEAKRDKYIIKYYAREDGKEIPEKDLWRIKVTAESHKDQHDPNQFYYIKNSNGDFIKDRAMTVPCYETFQVVPVKECNLGWCELYKAWKNKTLYVKEEALYK